MYLNVLSCFIHCCPTLMFLPLPCRLSKAFLKQFTVSTLFTRLGREFHGSITLAVQQFPLPLMWNHIEKPSSLPCRYFSIPALAELEPGGWGDIVFARKNSVGLNLSFFSLPMCPSVTLSTSPHSSCLSSLASSSYYQ